MVIPRDQNAGRSYIIKTNNSSFERVEQFKYLGTILTNQKSIQEEIKSRLKSGNSCNHSVQNLLSSSLLSKNIKIKVYRILYGCATCSLTLREECTPRMLENRVLRRIFTPKRDEVTGEWRKLHKDKLGDPYCSPNTFLVIKSRRMRGTGYVARMGERRGIYRVLVGNTDGKRPLVTPRRRW